MEVLMSEHELELATYENVKIQSLLGVEKNGVL